MDFRPAIFSNETRMSVWNVARGRALSRRPVLKAIQTSKPRSPRSPRPEANANMCDENEMVGINPTAKTPLPSPVKPRIRFVSIRSVENDAPPRSPSPRPQPADTSIISYLLFRFEQERMHAPPIPLSDGKAIHPDSKTCLPLHLIGDWLDTYTGDRFAFSSPAICSEWKLREVMALSGTHSNELVTALCCIILHSAAANVGHPVDLCQSFDALMRFVYSESMPSMLDKLTPTAFARTYLTSPQFATLYYKTAADVARRKSKLADARTEQDALLSRLDKKKLSFKLVLKRWRFNIIQRIFTAWHQYTVTRESVRAHTRAMKRVRDVMRGSMQITKRVFFAWIGYVRHQKATGIKEGIQKMCMKIAAFDQQIPELKENLQANLAAIKTMEAEERELREHNGAQSQELDHLLVLLEKHTPLVSTFIHDCWAVAAQRCLTRASNMWKRQIASLSFDYCDGTLFVDDITSSKPYDGRQLYEAGQRLSSGEIRNAFLRSALRPTPGMVDQCADKRGYIVTLPAGALNRHAMLPLSEDYGVRSEQQLDQRRKRIRTLIEMGDGEPVTADMKDLPPTVTVTEVIDGFVPQTLAVSALREVQQLSASTLMLRWMNAALAHGSASLFHTHCQAIMGPAPSDTANSRRPSMFGIPVPPALQLHQRIVGFGSEIKSGKALAIALHWIQRDDVKSNALDFVLHSSEAVEGPEHADALAALADNYRSLACTDTLRQSITPSLKPQQRVPTPRGFGSLKRQRSDRAKGKPLSPRNDSFRSLNRLAASPSVSIDRPPHLVFPHAARVNRISVVASPASPQLVPDQSRPVDGIIFQGKDIYQGNPTWTSAIVSQVMRSQGLFRIPYGYEMMESQALETIDGMVQSLVTQTFGMSKKCSKGNVVPRRSSTNQSEFDDPVEVLDAVDNVVSCVQPMQIAVHAKVSAARLANVAWTSAIDIVQAGMWHRVAGLVANTVISVPLPYTGAEGAESRADFLGKLQKRASTKESFPAPAAANGPSPTAQYGRTGSKKLVDIKQSRLAPFTTVSRARILDILSRSKHLSDYEDICVLLDQHAGPLEVLFSHYAWLTTEGNAVADAAGGLPPRATSAWGSNKGRAFIASSPVNDSNADIINKHQFWRFVKDANLLSDTLLPADVDYVLHRVNQYQSDEPLLVGSTAKPALPPPSSAIRGGSFKGRRSTIAVATPEGDDKAVAQPMRKVSRSPRKPNLLKSTVIGKEQFVEAIIRLSAMDVSALGTGIAKRLDTVIQQHLLPLIQSPASNKHVFRSTEFLAVFWKHKKLLRSTFLENTETPTTELMKASFVSSLSGVCGYNGEGDQSLPQPRRGSTEGAGEQRRSIVNVSPPTVEEDGPSYSRRDNMMSFPAPVTVELLGTGCVMNQSGWIRVLESLGAMGGRLTLPKAADLFSAVQPHASGRYLVYAEFCEALAAAALMLHPSPFTPASVRVNDALTKWTVNKAATA